MFSVLFLAYLIHYKDHERELSFCHFSYYFHGVQTRGSLLVTVHLFAL